MGGLNVTDVRRERIPLLWSTGGETALVKDCWSKMGGMHVSTEERSCLEGMCTVRSGK